MGLDMYLYSGIKKVCPHCGEILDEYDDENEEIYWRKANQIHYWFSEHCAGGEIENCKSYHVTRDQLKELLKTCEEVIKHSKIVLKSVKVKKYDFDKKDYVDTEIMKNVIEDPSYAQEVLPTSSGFFFGDTDYDEYYLEDVKYTAEKLHEIVDNIEYCPEEREFYYYAWW